MALTIQTLGEFKARRDGQSITDKEWKSQKNKNLFKILVTHHGHPVSKDQIMEWLWHNSTPDSAGRNLRVAVSQVRKALEPELSKGADSQYIHTTESGYILNLGTDLDIDLIRFEALCTQLLDMLIGEDSLKAIEEAEEIKALYQGPYLESDRYEDWAIAKREYVQDLYFNFLSALADAYAVKGQYRRAIAMCREILAHDPLRESACLQIMRYLYLAGDQAEALRTYEQFSHALFEQLGVDPGSSLSDLFEQIRENNVQGIEREYPRVENETKAIPYSLAPASTPFVGRDEELAILNKAAASFDLSSGQAVFLAGEAGVGKTRLIREWIEPLKMANKFRVLETSCFELDSDLSYRPWSRILNLICKSLPYEALEELDPVAKRDLAQISLTIQSYFPDLGSNPELEAEQQQRRLYKSVESLLSLYAHFSAPEAFVLIHIDDLHWSDYDSQQLIQYLVSRLDQLPIMLTGAYRSEEMADMTESWIKTSTSNGRCHEITLDRMSAHNVRDFLSQLPFDENTSSALSDQMFNETDGNPLFLVATLQHFFEEEQIRVEGTQWKTQSALEENLGKHSTPPSIQETLSQRLTHLNESELSLLRLVSILGTDVNLPFIQSTWDRNEPCLSTALDLVDAQLLTESGTRFQFSHPKLREVVLEQMSPALSQILHLKALHALEAQHGEQIALVASRLLYHAMGAAQWESAVRYSQIAADRALSAHHMREVLNLTRSGLEAYAKIGAEAQPQLLFQLNLLNRKASALHRLGVRDEQKSTLEHLLKLSEQAQLIDQQAQTHLDLASLYIETGDFGSAIEHAGVASDLAKRDVEEPAYANALGLKGTALHHQGKTEAALEALTLAVRLHRENGRQSELANALLGLGNIYFFTSAEYESARLAIEEALTIFVELNDAFKQAKALNNLGNVYYYALLKYDEAVEYYKQALEIFRAVGDRFGEGMALNNIGNVYKNLHLGKTEEAQSYLEQSIEACIEIEDHVGHAISLSVLADIDADLGRYEQSIEMNKRAIEICDQVDLPGEKSGSLFKIGRCYLELGMLEEAEREIQAALSIIREIGDERGVGYCESALGDIDRSREDYAEASEHYQKAIQVQEQHEIHDELVESLSSLALTHLAQGDLDTAFEISERAQQLLQDLENYSHSFEILYTHYQILKARNDETKAHEILAQAFSEVEGISNSISNLDVRSVFLDKVPAAREIVHAWEAVSLST